MHDSKFELVDEHPRAPATRSLTLRFVTVAKERTSLLDLAQAEDHYKPVGPRLNKTPVEVSLDSQRSCSADRRTIGRVVLLLWHPAQQSHAARRTYHVIQTFVANKIGELALSPRSLQAARLDRAGKGLSVRIVATDKAKYGKRRFEGGGESFSRKIGGDGIGRLSFGLRRAVREKLHVKPLALRLSCFRQH